MAFSKETRQDFLYRVAMIGKDSSYMQGKSKIKDLDRILKETHKAEKSKTVIHDNYFDLPQPHGSDRAEVITYSYFEAARFDGTMRHDMAELYGTVTYPREVAHKHQAKKIRMEKEAYLNNEDLYQKICESQIRHVDDNPHYLYVNLCGVRNDKINDFMTAINSAVRPEVKKQGYLRASCRDKQRVDYYAGNPFYFPLEFV